MCHNGCLVDPETKKCKLCGSTIQQIMARLKVPQKDQEHTLDMLTYRQYQ